MRGLRTNSQIFAERGDPWDHDERKTTRLSEAWDNPEIDQYTMATRGPSEGKGSMYCIGTAPKPKVCDRQRKLAGIANRMNLKLLKLKREGKL